MLKKNKTLSIITINYNNRDGLEKTISSVVKQTARNVFEWIIIDGNSNDGSKETIKKFDGEIDKWVSEPDSGIYNAMNKGISFATGKYIYFLNSGDVLVQKDTIEKCLYYLNEGYADFYIGHIITNKTNKYKATHPKTLNETDVLELFFFKGIPHQASFIKRSIFERFGLYDEEYKILADRFHFFANMLQPDTTTIRIPIDVAVYDQTGVSSTNKKLIEKDYELFFFKHPHIKTLHDFYKYNFEFTDSIKRDKVLFFFIRVWLYFKRLCHKKN